MRIALVLLVLVLFARADDTAAERSIEEIRAAIRNNATRVEALQELTKRGARGVAALPDLEAVLRADDWKAIEWAVRAAATMGEPAVPVLRKALAYRGAAQDVAARALAELGPRAAPAIPELVAMLRSRESSLAGHVLGRIGEPAIPALSIVFGGDHLAAHGHAANALAKMKGRGLDLLVIGTGDARPKWKAATVLALSQAGSTDPHVVRALANSFRASDAKVRHYALLGLTELGVIDRYPYFLTEALEDREARIRRLALRHAPKSADRHPCIRISHAMKDWKTVRQAMKDVQATPKQIPLYVELLSSSNGDNAARVLRSLGDRAKGTIPALRHLANFHDRTPYAAAYAIDAWSGLGLDADAVPLLRRILQPIPDRKHGHLRFVRETAAEALGTLGSRGADAVPELLKAMRHVGGPEPAPRLFLKLRIAAVRALAKVGPRKVVIPALLDALASPWNRYDGHRVTPRGIPSSRHPSDEPLFDDFLDATQKALRDLEVDPESACTRRLKTGAESATRVAALIAIERIDAQKPETLRALIAATKDPSRAVAYRALSHLTRHWTPEAKDAAHAALKSRDSGIRSLAVSMVGRHDRSAKTARALVKLLDDDGSTLDEWSLNRNLEMTVGTLAANHLRSPQLGQHVVGPIVQIRGDGKGESRRHAASIVAYWIDHGSPYILLAVVENSPPELRRAAAAQLLKHGPSSVLGSIKRLVAALVSEKDDATAKSLLEATIRTGRLARRTLERARRNSAEGSVARARLDEALAGISK